MQAQAALIFLHYTMFVVPLILLLLVPLVVSELQAMRPQMAYNLSGFVVVGVKSRRAGMAYQVNYRYGRYY